MTSPPFAVVRRGQEPVDQTTVRVRSRIVDKVVNDLGRRRQTQQVVLKTANQSGLIGTRRSVDRILFPPRDNETIDGRSHSIGRVDNRKRRQADGLKGPERQLFLREDGVYLFGGNGRRRSVVLGPDSSGTDPLNQQLYLRRAQRLIRRHLQTGGAPNRADEQTDVNVLCLNDRARVASLTKGSSGIESQATFLLIRAVATKAFRSQQRAHLHLEKRIIRPGCLA